MSRRLAVVLLLALLPLVSQCTHEPEDPDGPWRHRLYTPTYATKLNGVWLLVDTWHHRILYSSFPHADLDQWHTLTENIGGPHSIATDGDIMVYDDTGHGNLRAARHVHLANFLIDAPGQGEEYEIVFDVGIRPHRVIYDEAMKSFYAISSGSQEIVRVTNDQGRLVVRHRQELKFLNGAYTRSMTIIDGHMFFVTRGHGIIEATYRDDVFEMVGVYSVPDILDDLNDIFRSGAGWYYVTGTPRGIVRARSLADISEGRYEDLYEELGLEGTPYYLSEVDGMLILPEITDSSGVVTFRDAETGPITDISVFWDFGPPDPPDEVRKDQFPR